ncbi:MAG: DUF1772 domain-containing protein [Gemmatimonadaceae bacterium]|nr:DUF1772 domain-containing protein [Gemmatimonadaceae bacterium]
MRITRWVLWGLVLGYAFFLGGHLYEVTAVVPNWRSGDVADVARYRDFFARSGPGVYFERVLYPTLLLAMLAIPLTWSARKTRWIAAVPLLVIVAYAVWTIRYFVPINEYIGGTTYDAARLQSLVRGWVMWETWRALLVTVGLVASVGLCERWVGVPRRQAP